MDRLFAHGNLKNNPLNETQWFFLSKKKTFNLESDESSCDETFGIEEDELEIDDGMINGED